jgi:hypothetical protein
MKRFCTETVGPEGSVKRKVRKRSVFWDMTPCGSCKNRRFGCTYSLIITVERIGELYLVRVFLRASVASYC